MRARAILRSAVPRPIRRRLNRLLGRNQGVTTPLSGEEALVLRLLAPGRAKRGGGCMVDVGAHTGTSLRPFLHRGWRVLAFEPDPAKHPRLERLARRGRLELYPWALSDTPRDDVPFFTSEESTGIASLLPFRDSHREAVRVRVRTLRDVLEELGVDCVDYLKVDAEGYDLPVLRGFPWERVTPRVVMCEFEDAKTRQLGYGTDDLGGFLVERGYAVWMSEWHPIVRYGGEHRWRSIRRYPCACEDAASWGNFIAVRPEDAARFAELVERQGPLTG